MSTGDAESQSAARRWPVWVAGSLAVIAIAAAAAAGLAAGAADRAADDAEAVTVEAEREVAEAVDRLAADGADDEVTAEWHDFSAELLGVMCLSGGSRNGQYTSHLDTVHGWATFRCPSGFTPTGDVWTVRLPEPIAAGEDDWAPIGSLTIGQFTNHRVGTVHTRGNTPDPDDAVLVVDGCLFVTDRCPGPTADNVHVLFTYTTPPVP